MKFFVGFMATVFVFGVFQANATLVTSMPGGTVVPFPEVNYVGGGPQSFGPGITWSSTNTSDSLFGYDGYYEYLENGNWQDISMAGLNDSLDLYGVSDTMTFEFNSPVKGVGGFLNYFFPSSTNPTISVYDSSDSLIESTTLDFLTGGGTNTGQFFGFMENSNEIKYFKLTDAFIGITNLTVADGNPTVPEPTTLILFGTGLVGLLTARRRR